MNIHHPEHRQVAHLNYLTSCSAPRHVERARGSEFNTKEESAEDLNPFPYLEHIEIIANVESQPQPPTLSMTELYSGTGSPLRDYMAGWWESNPQGCLESNVQYNPYYPLVTHEEYQYIQWGINKKGMKLYYDNMMKEENTAQHLGSLKNMNGFQQLMASMRDTQVVGECELHTLGDMRWNDNHTPPVKYCSRNIIKSMLWLLLQTHYSLHHIYAPQNWCIGDTPLKLLYTQIQTADWTWDTKVRRETQE